ncbi:MAG: hypothetical protein RIT26_2087 [Pseudomonadota bacterium]
MAQTVAVNPQSNVHATKAQLEIEQKKLRSEAHQKALNRIVRIARQKGLNAAQITAALGETSQNTEAPDEVKPRRKPGRKAGFKVPPKYRDPANPNVTWTGRGRMPKWVSELHAKGELATALIKD